MTYYATCIVAVLSLVGSAIAGSPADAVRAATADLVRVPPDARPHVRYFSAYHADAEQRKEFAAVLSFWCNSLSREPDIVRPVECGPDLWRVDIRDYGWTRGTWEKLATEDPYFHVLGERAVEAFAAEEFDEYGYWQIGGKQVSKGTSGAEWVTTRKVPKPKAAIVPGKKTDIPQPAPWLPAKEYGALAVALNSNLPIARVDWWIYQTAVQKDRAVGYYDWLALGKAEKDFQELIGADVKLAQKVRKEIAAVVARSGVTLNNRSMERFATLTGSYWRTHDFKSSTFKQNTLRLLDGDTDPPKGDASEQYGSLPNELFAFWLQNDKGERQDAAPDFIASDGHATSTDRRVHIGVSCVRCHSPGIQPIGDWMRSVYRGPVQLASPDYEKLRRLRQLYLSDLDGHVRGDQQRYAAALLKCNGLTSQANAAAFSRVWERYADTDLDAAAMAADIGCTEADLLKALKAQTKIDPVLAGLLATPPVGVRREHWHETYSIMYSYMGGIK